MQCRQHIAVFHIILSVTCQAQVRSAVRADVHRRRQTKGHEDTFRMIDELR